MIKKNFLIFENYQYLLTILICSFFLFSGKWFFSFYFFEDNIETKILFDLPGDGYFYFPYVKALSEFDFNNSFDPNINNLKNLPIPIYSTLLHSIFYKIMGSFAFVFLEFIFIFLFLLIFYSILRNFNISKLIALTLSLFLFFLPILVNNFPANFFPYLLAMENLYYLRFPNPLVSNLFFYFYLFFLISLEQDKIFKIKNFIILAIILSFSLSSFYYFFIIQLISFFLFLLYKNNWNIISIFKNKFRYYFMFLIIFFLISLPFLYNFYLSEPHYSQRLYIIDLNVDKKIILISHLLKGIFKFEFLFVFFLIFFLTACVKIKKIKNYKLNIIFFIVFLSSIFSPFLFVIFSPKASLIYHFTNYIVVCGFLCLFFLLISIVQHYLIYNLNIKNFTKPLICLITIIIISYNLGVYKSYAKKKTDQEYFDYRNSIDILTKKIIEKKKNNKNLSILTFDSRLMIWSIMNEIQDIKLLSGQLVPKTHEMIENDLINSFKFLNLTDKNFIDFFENKNQGWRYLNKNTQLFFWGRYTANSLKTYKDSKNFDKKDLDFISNTSPLYMQSLIIPNDEFNRLKLKFINHELINFQKPTILIISKGDVIINKAFVSDKDYCRNFIGNKLIFYSLKKFSKSCD